MLDPIHRRIRLITISIQLNRTAPQPVDLHHIKLCYSKDTYCGHPRQSGIFNYGNGEIAVLHSQAPCRYRVRDDISHSFTTGYASRAQIILQRSLDHGETWPRAHDVVVWDESRPLEEKRALLYRADEPGVAREQIDLASPDAAYYFARPATGPGVLGDTPNSIWQVADAEGRPTLECFAFRSGDRGRTWESVPTRVAHPSVGSVHRDAHPLVQFPDGTFMGAMSMATAVAPGCIAVYGSDDSGLTWEYVAEVNHDTTGLGRPTYAGLILLPNGRLQCYMLNIGGARNAMQMAHSDDGGYSWSTPRPIVAWGHSLWAARRQPDAARPGVHYRSPWPMRLRDGRIIVLFGRRKPPFGIGLIVSEDDGATWSAEAIIRADGSGPDLGYPVATQLDDGRIFTAYYFMEDDGNNFGGTRYIAGSTFLLG